MKTNHKSLSAETYFTRGNEKSKSGDYKGAITDYNTAIHLKPDFARAYYKRGKAKSELGNFSAAKSDLEI
ncbi:MAG: tetratricopeptide repeat protein, partial [Candidatus Poribacteria bacterium]|nr:tetratricopeptide repeat protein [Candidatus Poribacteria bacterium]